MAVGKVTETMVGGDLVVTDESGESYAFKARTRPPLLEDIDSRIDLTKPMYQQVMRLSARDKAAQERAERRKRDVRAA